MLIFYLFFRCHLHFELRCRFEPIEDMVRTEIKLLLLAHMTFTYWLLYIIYFSPLYKHFNFSFNLPSCTFFLLYQPPHREQPSPLPQCCRNNTTHPSICSRDRLCIHLGWGLNFCWGVRDHVMTSSVPLTFFGLWPVWHHRLYKSQVIFNTIHQKPWNCYCILYYSC